MHYLDVFIKNEVAREGKVKKEWKKVGAVLINKGGRLLMSLEGRKYYLAEPDEPIDVEVEE